MFTEFKTVLIFTLISGAIGFGSIQASADSRSQRALALCEDLLVAAKLFPPKVRAQIMPSSPKVTFIPGVWKVIVTPAGTSPQIYSRTNRSFGDLTQNFYYPSTLLNLEEWRGKKILDLACGDGAMVRQLRRKGIDIVGLDAALNPKELARPFFIQASADDTGLPAESFDLIISTQGPISYQFENKPEFVAKILAEAERLLKPGGRLLIGPLRKDVSVDHTKIEPNPIQDFAGTGLVPLPGRLFFEQWPDRNWFLNLLSLIGEDEDAGGYWVVIAKPN